MTQKSDKLTEDISTANEWDNNYKTLRAEMVQLKESISKNSSDAEKAVSSLKATEKAINDLEAIKAKLVEADVFKEEGNPNSNAALAALTPSERMAHRASIEGDRKTLRADSYIPATMAVIYLLILLYFKSIGGYKPVTIGEREDE